MAKQGHDEATPSTLPGFNPSKDPRMDHIKVKTDELIQYVRDLEGGDGRCKSLAMTNYEQAAMWAVKSIFARQV